MKRGTRKVVSVVLMGLLGLQPALQALAQTTAAGFTPASFRVTESGGAAYEIPIRVPPGIAGMEPKLALVYGSQNGNGAVGMGWSLSGLSAVTRCPRTLAQDGVRGRINYDANDRFCLDGQRLLQVSGGSYGAVNAEYRTERESHAKVVSVGGSAGNPSHFEVKTKAGMTMRYGYNTDSAIEAQGSSTVRVWALDRMLDTKGNAVTVAYTEDNTNGSFQPASISYGGSNSVAFVYESRTDKPPLYEAGSKISTQNRLVNIRTYVDTSTMVTDYRLSYEYATSTGRSRLVTLKECTGDGAYCMPTLAFGWQNGGQAINTWDWSSTSIGTADGYQHFVADVNGDGKADLVQIQRSGSNNLTVGLSNGTDFTLWTSSWSSTSVGQENSYQHYLADVNGDGLADLIQVDRTSASVSVGLSTGSAFTTWSKTTTAIGSLADFEHYFADVNGDGLADWIQIARTSNTAYIGLANGDGSFASLFGTGTPAWNQVSGYVGSANDYQHYFADVNGDGLADLIQVSRTTNNAYVGLSNGDGTFASLFGGSTWTWSSTSIGAVNDFEHQFADVNGDGRADWIQVSRASNAGYVGLSNGDGTFQVWSFGSYSIGATDGYDHRFADINGDGKADWIQIQKATTNNAYIGLSVGDGSFDIWTGSTTTIGTSNGFAHFLGDVDGDGKPDWVQIQRSTTNNGYVGKSSGAIPDLMTTVTTGSDLMVTFTYKPLTNALGSVYTKDSSATYPIVNLQAPLYVVSGVAANNGLGSTQSTTYTYGGLRAEMGTGRGLLGFRWNEATQTATGLVTRVEYSQTWPYTGYPTQVKRTLSSVILSQTDNTFACLNPATSAACSVSAGNRYLPYSSQVDEVSRDLNGAFISKVRTENGVPDVYGNVPTIAVTHLTEGGSATGYSKTTTNTYTNDTTNWFLGRLTRSSVLSAIP